METQYLEEFWNKYSSLFKKAFGDNANTQKFLDAFGERIVLAPASHKVDQKYCEVGGLMKQSIDIAIAMKKIAEALDLETSPTSILRIALSHDLGKLGTEDQEYFLDQDSDWHREKLGAMYKFNDKVPRMPVPHLSVFLVNSYGLELTLEETRAIMTSGGLGRDENKSYGFVNSSLQSLFQAAKLITVQTQH
jgi:hypothetical protein